MFKNIRDYLAALVPIKNEEMVMFVVQLANLLGAGISLVVALDLLCRQVSNRRFQAVLQQVLERVREGKSLSEALREHPAIFSEVFVNMVAAGEASGELEAIMKRLAKFFEYEAEIRAKVATALFYPVVLLVVGTVVLTAVIVLVLPAFVNIFLAARLPLPLPTRILYALSVFLRNSWFWILLLLFALAAAYRYYNRPRRAKIYFDRIKLRLPIFGRLIRESNISRFFRVFAMLFASGLPLIRILEISVKVLDNLVVAGVVNELKDSVSRGTSMAEPMRESRIFPPLAVQMVVVGEETGALDAMLTRVADYYDFVIDDSIKKMTRLLEPLFLLVLGGGIGFIFAAMLLPMFQMAGTC